MTSLADWRLATQHLDNAPFLMPTLETASIFHATHNDELAIALTESFAQPILALRVGGMICCRVYAYVVRAIPRCIIHRLGR